MKHILIGQALSDGWKQFTRRPWYLLGIALTIFVLFVVTAGNNSAVTALSYILYGGFVAFLLRHANGETVVFDDLFEIVDKRWIYFAFLGIIKSLLIFLGLLFFIVPGVYLAIRWMFAELLVIDKGLRPMEALKASSEMTEGVRGKLFLYALVSLLLVIVGVFAFLIGAVVAGIVVQLASIRLYKDLSAPVTEVVEEHHHG